MSLRPNRPSTSSHPGDTAPHRTSDQRDYDREEMLKLLARGWTISGIARRLRLDIMQVAYDCRMVLQRIRQHRLEETWENVHLKLEEYAEIKREAWEAWERSKLPAEKETTEDFISPTGQIATKVGRVRTGQVGDKTYLHIVLDCLKAERDLLSIDPPKNVRVQGHIISWDVLAGKLPPGPVPDEIEAEIQKAMIVHEAALDALEEQSGFT